MKLETLSYIFNSIKQRKLRTFLSIISIIVGIMAIFSLISFGQGLRDYMNDFAKKMGTDKIIITSKGRMLGLGSSSFDEKDVDFVRKIKGVDEATAWMLTQAGVKNKDTKKTIYPYIAGYPTDKKEQRLVEEVSTIKIIKGRDLKKGDVLKTVLGYNYQLDNKIFKKKIKLGDTIIIKDKEVEVVGFYEEVGNPQDDSNVYLTYEGFKELFGKDNFSYIIAKADEGVNVKELSENIKERFRKHKGIKKGKEDFSVQTFEQLLEVFGNIIIIINAVLVMIALISLVVAAINIANIMYTAVLERTKEIGIMKAVGAKNKDIVFLFVLEAGIIGLVGGIVGSFFGFIVSKIGEYIAQTKGLAMLKPAFPIWLILFCLGFAFFIGIISGFFPALQASKLNPSDSLRYE